MSNSLLSGDERACSGAAWSWPTGVSLILYRATFASRSKTSVDAFLGSSRL